MQFGHGGGGQGRPGPRAPRQGGPGALSAAPAKFKVTPHRFHAAGQHPIRWASSVVGGFPFALTASALVNPAGRPALVFDVLSPVGSVTHSVLNEINDVPVRNWDPQSAAS